eukprot:m.622642 g.622642  ORF g.622642 m.622642 type:complete len:70 (-) comp58219_c1_seq8:2025-2234(-)
MALQPDRLSTSFEFLTDRGGWNKPCYYETIQSITVGKFLYLLGREPITSTLLSLPLRRAFGRSCPEESS